MIKEILYVHVPTKKLLLVTRTSPVKKLIDSTTANQIKISVSYVIVIVSLMIKRYRNKITYRPTTADIFIRSTGNT